MKKHIIFITLLNLCYFAFSQTTDPRLLVDIQNASQSEIDAYNPADLELGMLVYNTDENRIYEYTDIGFLEILTEASSDITVYTGFFILGDTAGGSGSFTQTITGLPFEPSQITFVAHANVDTIDLNSDNGVGNNDTSINNSYGSMNGFVRGDNGTITQQVIYVGGSGNSINDISRYASSSNCIGVRYGNQNGSDLGTVFANLTTFTADGFTLNTTRTLDATTENLVVLYTAYK